MIDELLKKIFLYEESIESLSQLISEYSSKKNILKRELKKICIHPDNLVELKSERITDDYGSYNGTDYWWYCKQCECESSKNNWDYDRGVYRLGSRRPVANIYYKELTKRDLPVTKKPPF